MHNSVKSPDHQLGLQPDERFHHHVNTLTASHQGETRIQAQVAADLSLQLGVLHRYLRYLEQETEFHEPL